jgi:hypothetical protein
MAERWRQAFRVMALPPFVPGAPKSKTESKAPREPKPPRLEV